MVIISPFTALKDVIIRPMALTYGFASTRSSSAGSVLCLRHDTGNAGRPAQNRRRAARGREPQAVCGAKTCTPSLSCAFTRSSSCPASLLSLRRRPSQEVDPPRTAATSSRALAEPTPSAPRSVSAETGLPCSRRCAASRSRAVASNSPSGREAEAGRPGLLLTAAGAAPISSTEGVLGWGYRSSLTDRGIGGRTAWTIGSAEFNVNVATPENASSTRAERNLLGVTPCTVR
ncbi:MAG: hypothetical protein JWN00_6168 [Actinomycetia bacterium]|nr:hypothetical protein [Actinomycetes bacterium]